MEILIDTAIKGFIIGVFVSAPMGPVGVLCIQRTLNKGRVSGLYTGVGAAISDLLYALLTGFGMSMVIDFIETNAILIKIIGSIVLAGFGLYVYRQNPAKNLRQKGQTSNSNMQDLITAFFLTFSNPLILFLFIGLFARLNFFLPESSLPDYIVGYIAIIAGALSWWFTITYFINKVRTKFNIRSLWIVNRGIGTLILILSVIGFVTGLIEISKIW